MDIVLAPFGDMGHGRREVEAVASAPEVVDVVVLEIQLSEVGGAQIAAESQHAGLELPHLGIAVGVVVVGAALAIVAKNGQPRLAVLAHHRCVERVAHVPRLAANKIGGVANTGRIVARLAGDDVHHTGNGIAAIESRTAAAQHLHPVDQGRGQLVEQVDTRQRAVHRTAIDENLRIGLAETVDTHLVGTAILAGVLHPQACAEVERLAEVHGTDRFHLSAIDNTHRGGGLATRG